MQEAELNIKTNIPATLAGLRELKRELKEISVTDPRFKEKQQEVDDYTDALNAAKTGAGNFADVLSGLPGPIGNIGSAVSGTVQSLKQFSALKFTDIKSSFVELGKDVIDAAKGIANLTGLTKVYTTLNNALASSFVKVGIAEETAAVGAKLFSSALIATGIGAVIVLLGNLATALMEYFDASEQAKKAADDYSDALKRQNEILDANLRQIDFETKKKLLQAKIAGQSEEELNKITAKGLENRLQLVIKANNNALQEQKDLARRVGKFAKISDEERAALIEKNLENIKTLGKQESDLREQIAINGLEKEASIAEKSRQTKKTNSDKNIALTQQELKQIAKDREDARISLLSDEGKEIANIEKNYKVKIDLAKKHGQDTKDLEEAKSKEIEKIRQKYRKQESEEMKNNFISDLQTIMDENKKNYDTEKLQLDLQKAQGLIDENTYQQRLYDIKLKYANSDADIINAEIENLNYLNQKKKENAENAKLYTEQQIAYNKAVRESWQDLGNNIANNFMQIANLFEKGSDAAKTFAIASVLINAAVSISKINDTFATEISDAKKSISAGITAVATGTAISPVNPVQGSLLIAAGTKAKLVGGTQLALAKANKGLQIAAVGASAAAQIAAITSSGKSKSASVSSGGGSAGGSAPSFGGIPSTPTPQIQSGEGINPSAQIAQTIGAAQKPIQAYVVSTQISSQQALDRRTNAAATFS